MNDGYQSTWDHEAQGPPCLYCSRCDCECADFEPSTMAVDEAREKVEQLKREFEDREIAFRSAA